MASTATVRWNESAGRWMAWVRFPDGARRKIERVDRATAQRDLDELLTLRAQNLEPPPRRQQAASFAQVIDAWLDAGCLVKVADLAGHVNTKTTQGYRHPVRPSLPHAIEAWERLLERGTSAGAG
jgi:hypothetical protein